MDGEVELTAEHNSQGVPLHFRFANSLLVVFCYLYHMSNAKQNLNSQRLFLLPPVQEYEYEKSVVLS